MNPMTIGQLARASGVRVETIRYWEKRGLIPAPARRDSGYRQYAPPAVERLRFIQAGKALGFSLREIGELLDLRLDPGARCADVKERVDAKIEDVRARIAGMRKILAVLEKLSRACREGLPADECPILESLEAPPRSVRANKKGRR